VKADFVKHPTPGTVLQVNLFGCPKVVLPRDTVARPLGQKAGELLALLLLRGHHSHHREKLATLLWPESSPECAAHSLRTTLWRLRQALEPQGVARGTYLSNARTAEIAFNWDSEFAVDVLEFQTILGHCDATRAPAASDAELADLENALRLYEGELLEGHCDDWVVYERERMRDLFIRGLCYMMREQARRNEFTQAIDCGRRVLAEDPLHEAVHRELMELYVCLGQRAEAIRLYEQLNLTLETELEVAPARETTQVYVRILQMERRTRPGAGLQTGREISDTVSALQSSLDALAREHARMTRTLDELRDMISPDLPDSD
jgi:DNA-binding SARP family transcriptional activator